MKDTQSANIENLKRKVERLKSGIWAIESVCPPFGSLFKNYELQKDIFLLSIASDLTIFYPYQNLRVCGRRSL